MRSPVDAVKAMLNELIDYAVHNCPVPDVKFNHDGTEVKTARQFAAVAGIPLVEARARMARKDVYTGAGGANVPVGVGTVTPRHKKRRTGRLYDRAHRMLTRECDCPPGEHTDDECDG